MDILAKAHETYENRGLYTVFRQGIRYALQNPLHQPLDRILGANLHEKLIAAPAVGYWPQVENPGSFNEKIINRKLYTNNDLYKKVTDKYRSREYVRNKAGEEILNDIYYIGGEPGEIPFKELPREFVVKATHGSGWNIIVRDKSRVDRDDIQSRCRNWLSKTYGCKSREYWYEEITPQIIVEEFINDEEYGVPPDFKFYVFQGRVEFIHVDFNRFSGQRSRRFFDRDWNAQNFTLEYPLGPDIDKPERLNDMIEIAEKLGEDFDFARVDLYHTSTNDIYFGEITLAPGAGSETFKPMRWDFKIGSYW